MVGNTFETVAVRIKDTDHNAPARSLPPRSDQQKMQKNPPFWHETVIDQLASNDFCIVAKAFPDDFCADLRADLRAAPLRPAAVGRGQSRLLDQNIRNDSTCWLDGSTP